MALTTGSVSMASAVSWDKKSLDYYRYTAKRPPRELLVQLLTHLAWEKKSGPKRTAIDVGFGAGTDTLELLKRGWRVLAIDGQRSAASFLSPRVAPRLRSSLTIIVSPMEELELPSADLVYASFSLPFCSPNLFPAVWRGIRKAVRPGGHFAGQLFGNHDSWRANRSMSFHSRDQVVKLARGFKLEMLRETEEDGMAFSGPKHWHYFDLILEKSVR